MKPKKSHSKVNSQLTVNVPEHRIVVGVFVGLLCGSIFAAICIMFFDIILAVNDEVFRATR